MIDALFIAPHPDDAEIFCGGTISKLIANGHNVVIADLTKGELSSRGTVTEREKETRKASKVMGVKKRVNLSLTDGGLCADGSPHQNKQLVEIVKIICEQKPKIIFAPHWLGRHPDHCETSKLVQKAVFFSNVKKFVITLGVEAWSIDQLIFYQMRQEFSPSFIVNISEFVDVKQRAINCYSSQLAGDKSDSAHQTLVGSELMREHLLTRDRYFGAMIGKSYGEAFCVNTALAVEDPVQYLVDNSVKGALFFPTSD